MVFFAFGYIIYEIETILIKDKLKYLVTRRYSDFYNLRSALQKQFPYYLIPPLPGKKLGLRRFDYDFIMKRMNFLNRFIRNVINIEEFKTSDFLISFLTCQDRNQFEIKMKEINYIPESPIYIDNIKTLSGKIQIYNENNINSNNNYFTNVQNYFILQNQLLEKLNEGLKNFNKTMLTAFTHLENIQKYFESLYSINSQVYMKEDIIKSYEELGIFFKNWKNVILNQNDIIRKKIKDFYKYVKMEGEVLLELYNKRNELQDNYIKENKRLQNKKDKLWEQMDLSKWEIMEDFKKIDRVQLITDKEYGYSKMCTNETNNLINLKKNLGYVNSCCINELKKLVDKYKISFVDNIKDFSGELYTVINDSLNAWSQMASSIEDKKI